MSSVYTLCLLLSLFFVIIGELSFCLCAMFLCYVSISLICLFSRSMSVLVCVFDIIVMLN